MSLHLRPELIRRFLALDEEQQRRMIATLSPADALTFDADFEMWAHRGQLPPTSEGWRTWLMMAGRGYGKTRAGAEWINRLAQVRPVRIALVAASLDEARRVMVEGVSGILAVARARRERVRWEPSLGQLRWPRGSIAQLFSGDHADGLRGPEHEFAWCDEIAKWRQGDAAWDNLQMGLRAGVRPRALVTTTPRSIPLMHRIREDSRTVETGGRTTDNISLPSSFVDVMMDTYGGTRLGRQELNGELLKDCEGALWPRGLIERSRAEAPGAYDAVIVGVDPPAGVGAGVDACGIVVAGRSEGRHYVLADESVQGLSPEGWANRVAAAAARWNATLIVAEANNGGAMVASVLKAAEVPVRVKLVHAVRGKAVRAEPIALRFEAGRAFLAGTFPELEEEMAGMAVGGIYAGPTRSPDRADAMVWAMTELGETRSGVPRVRGL